MVDPKLNNPRTKLSKESRDLCFGNEVLELPECSQPEPLEFMRFVAQNKPFIIRRYHQSQTAVSNEDLLEIIGDKLVTLSKTPDGWADATREYQNQMVFMLPHEETLPFAVALRAIQDNDKREAISYLQAQNDCLRTEYAELLDSNNKLEIPADISWATKALGYDPDAVNLWIGTRHSTTSLHKDSYENLYLVLRGRKRFRLYPPTDCLRFPQRIYPAYRWDSDLKSAQNCQHQVPWYPNYPNDDTASGQYSEAFMVTLELGDLLYLPALWYHAVEQEEDENGLCVAVNYWYDMFSFDKQCYMNALQTLAGNEIIQEV